MRVLISSCGLLSLLIFGGVVVLSVFRKASVFWFSGSLCVHVFPSYPQCLPSLNTHRFPVMSNNLIRVSSLPSCSFPHQHPILVNSKFLLLPSYAKSMGDSLL